MKKKGSADERTAALAFDRQSPLFDDLYTTDPIVQYKRQRVRAHVMSRLAPGSRILELNAGTGDDAVYFAQQGHQVYATDISTGMQKVLGEKVKRHALQHLVSQELCSYTSLNRLSHKGPYDLIFSNFAGLNCTDKLAKVLEDLPGLLNPGGMITLVFLPKFCLWEFLLLFKGRFKTATRRLLSKRGASAHIEGVIFKCWYYRPSFVIRHLRKSCVLIQAEGLCTLVPPSYLERFAENHPLIYRFLQKSENRLKGKWPWKYLGDYVILTFKKLN